MYPIMKELTKQFKLSEAQRYLLSDIFYFRNEGFSDIKITKYKLEHIKISKRIKNTPYYITYLKPNGKYTLPISYNRNINDYEIDMSHKVNQNTLNSLVRKGILETTDEIDFHVSEKVLKLIKKLDKNFNIELFKK